MIQDYTQHLGVLSISIHIPGAQSLKEKRFVVKSLKDQVRRKFNVSIAELDGQNKWQTATLGFVMISNDSRYLDSCLAKILLYVERFGRFVVCDHCVDFY